MIEIMIIKLLEGASADLEVVDQDGDVSPSQ